MLPSFDCAASLFLLVLELRSTQYAAAAGRHNDVPQYCYKVLLPPATMLFKSALLSTLAACAVDAATKIAVIEFGKGGSVRRTTASNADTTVDGVASFWAVLHQNRRNLQHAGMTLVPDLFKKPDNGVVIGISGSGVDLDTMPFIAGLVLEESNDVVGHFEVTGTRLDSLMSRVDEWETIDVASLVDSTKKHGEKVGLSGFKTVVDSSTAAAVDQKMSDILGGLKNMAETTGKTIIVHLVVEEEVASARRRVLARRLEENNADGDNADGDNADGDNADGQQQASVYYGYGYYNENKQWVTPYKTMFQIQYFNIVLWTSLGLVATLFFVIYMMIYMPLEPDTLLFGESAKLPGQD
jgi:hypothetical protein